MKRLMGFLMALLGVAGLALAQKPAAPVNEPRAPDAPDTGRGRHRTAAMGFAGSERGTDEDIGLINRIVSSQETIEKLGLTEPQIKMLKEEGYRLKMQQIDLRAALDKAAVDQARRMTEADVKEDALMEAVEKTGRIRTDLARLNVKELLLLKKTLTPEQLQEIRKRFQQRREERALERERLEKWLQERREREGKDFPQRREKFRERTKGDKAERPGTDKDKAE